MNLRWRVEKDSEAEARWDIALRGRQQACGSWIDSIVIVTSGVGTWICNIARSAHHHFSEFSIRDYVFCRRV